MTTNASPEYGHAEKAYNEAITLEEKLTCLEKMLSTMPQHKSAEAMRANLRTRYKKLQERIEKGAKSGRSTQQGIKKAEMQAIIIGMPNTGKSSLFQALTKQQAKISHFSFTTFKPQLGTMEYEDVKIQIIDTPPIPTVGKSLINVTDTLLLVADSIEQIAQSQEFISKVKTKAKTIVIFNKIDLLSEQERRKIQATLNSRKYNFILFSSITHENLQELKTRIFKSFPIMRVYTKEPKKPATFEPMIMRPEATVGDAAEKILKGMSKKIKKARIWGPSSTFGGQIVGIDHVLKDKDVVEFQTE